MTGRLLAVAGCYMGGEAVSETQRSGIVCLDLEPTHRAEREKGLIYESRESAGE